MGQKSTVVQIDPEVKSGLDAMIREGRATIDEMKDYLDEQLGDDAPSRSSVGRYKQSMEKSMETYKATQEMARVWANKMESEPGSEIAQLASQVLGGVALHTANTMINTGEAMPAGEVMFLAKALDHLAKAEKTITDREMKIREKVTKQNAEAATKVARQQGMSADAVAMIRQAIEQGVAA